MTNEQMKREINDLWVWVVVLFLLGAVAIGISFAYTTARLQEIETKIERMSDG